MSSSPAAAGLVAFLNESVTAYHAVESLTRQLEADGFEKLNERLTWDVKPGKAYFVTRNKSAVLAFTVGGSYKPGNGFTITGAHTDSPCLRLKPVSSLTKAGGVLSVGVETYGGGLWYTWLDRDLSVAGRVIVEAAPGRYESRLVRIPRPILRIPSLAIHLQRDVNSEGLKLNAETHLPPLLCTAVKARLEEDAASTAATGGEGGAASAAVGVGVVGPAGAYLC
jgi:aspartyl aminopeptidase